MIAALKGKILTIQPDSVIMMVQGVGYELACSTSTLAELKFNEENFLHVYTHVSQDSLQLFGFSQKQEKQLFLTLLKVNGIGVKSAIQILSGTTISELTRMIDHGDVKALSMLPKIGKKTAEQMILTLKGKLVISEEGRSPMDEQNTIKSQINSALVHLGFRSNEVEKVIKLMPETITMEEGVRQGLAALTNL